MNVIKPLLTYLLALVALAGTPLGMSVIFGSEFWDTCLHIAKHCWPVIQTIYEHVDARTWQQVQRLNPNLVSVVFALLALVFSLVRWCASPSGGRLFLLLFCGWVLCGLPGIYLFILCNSSMPGDGPILPGPYDTILY